MSFDLKVVNGDLVLKNSDFSVVRDNDKLAQDLIKIALTEVGSNVLQPWYGSLLSRTLIGSVLNADIVISSATSQLQNAIENLKKLQNLQVSSGQKVSPSEQIAAVSAINIERNNVDPRLFSVLIRVLDRSFSRVNASFNVSNT